MDVTITGKQVRVTPTLQKYIYERVQKVEKYLSQPAHLVMTLKTEKYRKIAEAHLNLNGVILQAEEETNAMPASVDKAMAKIERQLNRHKDRVSDHRVRRDGRSIRVDARKTTTLSREPLLQGSAGRLAAPVGKKRSLPRVQRETVSIEPLTLEEAIAQRAAKKTPFFLFRNRLDGSCGLLYARADGQLGLIEGIV